MDTEVVDCVRVWADRTEITAEQFIRWLDVARVKHFDQIPEDQYNDEHQHDRR